MNLSQNKQRAAGQSGKHSTSVLLQSFSTHNRALCLHRSGAPELSMMYHNNVNCWSAEIWEGRSTHHLHHPPTLLALDTGSMCPCLVAQGAWDCPRVAPCLRWSRQVSHHLSTSDTSCLHPGCQLQQTSFSEFHACYQ